MTEDLAARLLAAIENTERIARDESHHTDSSEAYSCPATRTESVGDLPFGEDNCTCGLATRQRAVLRRCAADRKILTEHAPADFTAYGDQLCRRCTVNNDASDALHDWMIWPCPTLLALAEGYGLAEEPPAVTVPAGPLTFHTEQIGMTLDGKPIIRAVPDQAITVDHATGAITNIEEAAPPPRIDWASVTDEELMETNDYLTGRDEETT